MTALLPGFQDQLEARATELARDDAAWRAAEQRTVLAALIADGEPAPIEAEREAREPVYVPHAGRGERAPRARADKRRRSGPRRAGRAKRWGGPHGRGLVVAILAGTLGAGGVAYAAQQILWKPQLGMPGRGEPATVGTSPVPPDQLALLGVLRRPQNEADRGAGTRAALTFQGKSMQGLRVDAVRRLGTSAEGGAIVLMPVERWDAGLPTFREGGPSRAPRTDQLCLWLAVDGDGGGQTCSGLSDLRAGRMMMGSWGPPLEERRRIRAEQERRQERMKAEARRQGLTFMEYVRRQERKLLRKNGGTGTGRLITEDTRNYVADIVQVIPDGVTTVRYHHLGKTLFAPVKDNVLVLHLAPSKSGGVGTAWLDADGYELYKGSRFPQRKPLEPTKP